MTIEAGSWDPLDHSNDRFTGVNLGSHSTKKNVEKTTPKEQQTPKKKSWFKRFMDVFR